MLLGTWVFHVLEWLSDVNRCYVAPVPKYRLTQVPRVPYIYIVVVRGDKARGVRPVCPGTLCLAPTIRENAMPFIPVPNGVLAEVRMLLDGQKIENTLWFNAGATATQAQMATLANDLLTWWTSQYAPIVSNEVKLSEIYVTAQHAQGAEGFSLTAPGGTQGANTNPAAANHVALCVSFRTSGRGRSARGRNYISGLQAVEVVSNDLAASKVQAAVNCYGHLATPANTGGMVWSVCSRYQNKVPRAAGILQPIVSVLVTDSVVDSQRRRLPGRGK